MIRFRRLRCSFCRKTESEVAKLVAGPRVYICDSCVSIAEKLMKDASADNQPPGQFSAAEKLWARLARLFRIKSLRTARPLA